jgi:hypothetical protein
MDGADWLRTQLTSFGCATCGRAYAPEGVRVLAERDELFFVDLACLGCGTRSTAIVTIALEEGAARADAPDLEPLPGAARASDPAEPIGLDDVLDVHQLLAGWEGDLRGLLRRFDGVEGTVTR